MSSMSRSIRREMRRKGLGIAMARGKMLYPNCPKCGTRLTRSRLSRKKVRCTNCGFTGRVK